MSEEERSKWGRQKVVVLVDCGNPSCGLSDDDLKGVWVAQSSAPVSSFCALFFLCKRRGIIRGLGVSPSKLRGVLAICLYTN